MANFEAIHECADRAGRLAAHEAEVEMIVVTDGVKEYPPFPICGFAWISFAGNTAWGRWAKNVGLARKGYPKGLTIWVSAYEQSYDLKLAYAAGYADELWQHGIVAHAEGRLD